MRLKTLLYTLGIGAGLMYLYDPNYGQRRRAQIRDKFESIKNQADDNIDVAMTDMRNRTRGFFADMMAMVDQEEAPDWLLEERVRARLGRNVGHAGAIEVKAEGGRVTLSGPILAHEVDRAVTRVAKVRGVRSVDNQLTVHERPDDVPGLQGVPSKRMEKPEWAQENWSPSMRLLTGVGGGLLAAYGMTRRGLVGTVLSLSGLGLAARGVANLDMGRLLGLSERRDAININKAININAPVENLYRFWSNFENFPRFMEHIREVKDMGEGRSSWKAVGPANTEFEWNAYVTRDVPNEEIAWESEPGSQVKTRGRVHFRSNPGGGTRVTVHWSYTPPAGAVGHAIASLMGADPKHAMDEDLARVKTLFEHGKTTAKGKEVTLSDLGLGMAGAQAGAD